MVGFQVGAPIPRLDVSEGSGSDFDAENSKRNSKDLRQRVRKRYSKQSRRQTCWLPDLKEQKRWHMAGRRLGGGQWDQVMT